MKKRLISALLVLAGLAMVSEPLKAVGSCGLNPEIMVPSSCEAPKTSPPNPIGGICDELQDGTCLSIGCGVVTWENAIPGICGNGLITENGIPRCESDYAATAISIKQYIWACESKKSCKCALKVTGQTTTVTVCNCRDLEPLH